MYSNIANPHTEPTSTHVCKHTHAACERLLCNDLITMQSAYLYTAQHSVTQACSLWHDKNTNALNRNLVWCTVDWHTHPKLARLGEWVSWIQLIKGGQCKWPQSKQRGYPQPPSAVAESSYLQISVAKFITIIFTTTYSKPLNSS